jgi:2-dehydropantoate 2-reductase
MKSVFLEHELSAASSARHREVVALFRGAGFSLSFQKDMTVWYWVHFILNAGMAAGALKHGSYRNLYSSPRYVKEAILLMRDMLPLVAAKGRRVDSLTRIALGLPAGLTAFAAYKVLSGSSVAAAIMERMESTAYIPKESFAQFPKEVLAEARKLGVALPRLEAFESYWS